MSALTTISPQSQAVLSLVLVQAKSFDEIAALLRMDTEDVRVRARSAAAEIAPPPAELDDDERGAVSDYVLGQLPVSARMQIRARLREAGPQRDWALSLSAALSPLAREPLPPVPELVQERPVVVDEPEADRSVLLEEPAAAPIVRERRRPALPRWRVLGSLGVLLVVALVLVVALSSGGTKRAPASAKRTLRSSATRTGANAVQTIKRLVLAPTSLQPSALGAGAVVRQRGSLLLLLQAKGLAANHGDSYGVWLFNSSSDARLLGFVAPPVGSAGTFSSGVALPDDAVRFRMLVITREQAARPTTPGPVVLHGSLSLS